MFSFVYGSIIFTFWSLATEAISIDFWHKSNLRKNSIDNYFETEPSLWPLKRNNLKAVEFFKLLLRASLRCFHQQI
jgi:hypothetical protein